MGLNVIVYGMEDWMGMDGITDEIVEVGIETDFEIVVNKLNFWL